MQGRRSQAASVVRDCARASNDDPPDTEDEMSTWPLDMHHTANDACRPRTSRCRPRTAESATMRAGAGARRRTDALAGHVFRLPVVRELPPSYPLGDDTTW